MGLSKSNKIIILLIIDTIFFFIEISVGYAVHSLALVADSFHMLNDVLSLCVGLWAVKVANQKPSSKMYTYGWRRAETLGALVNGVFLVALCVSIFLEAIQRFVEPQVVNNPKLICIVGCCGLASNILGLLLFHDHGHGHGHSHETEEPVDSAERGLTSPDQLDSGAIADQTGTVASVMPQNVVDAVANEPGPQSRSARHQGSGYRRRDSRRFSASSRGFRDTENFYVHPASLRQDIIQASRFEDEPSSDSASEEDNRNGGTEPSERSRLLPRGGTSLYSTSSTGQKASPKKEGNHDLHHGHNHAKPKDSAKSGGGHGHSHDLNMRGVFLHVVGDALGNIGVIASALFIWLTDYEWRYYVDPGISLLITVIILCSAIPLCKAASRILLQAVPAGMSVDHIIEDIGQLPGVVSCHHLHVWQLSDTQLVASLHIQVSFDIKGEGSARYMTLARHVRRCLHAYGIHSSTIQPEFHPSSDSGESSSGSLSPASNHGAPQATQQQTITNSPQDPSSCLLECGNECASARQCCS